MEVIIRQSFMGLKVSVGKSTIFGEEIQNLRRLIEKGEFTVAREMSLMKKSPTLQDYIKKNIPSRKG